jgi:hypothetical protein
VNELPLFPMRERGFFYGIYSAREQAKGDFIHLERQIIKVENKRL